MNARQVATGTLLAASLTIGGGAVANARPGPATDRFEVPCERIAHRLDLLQHHQEVLAARRARVEARLADARAAGHVRLIRALELQLRQVDRAALRLAARIDEVEQRWFTNCAPPDNT